MIGMNMLWCSLALTILFQEFVYVVTAGPGGKVVYTRESKFWFLFSLKTWFMQ